MQAPSRSMQRRSPGAEPGPPPNVPVRSISPAVGPGMGNGGAGHRPGTSSSGRSGGGHGGSTRRANNSAGAGATAVPLSQIEKSVTHLLVATKQLLETLTQWSRGNATDAQVSDVYVRLGYEFNMACRAFTAINVDTRDLGNVPEDLRSILEATLSQEASVESLEKYLPKIRDIIINLLHGLKRKQQKLRQRQSKDKDDPAARTTSTSTTGSAASGLTSLLNEGLEDGYRPDLRRDESASSKSGSSGSGSTASPARRFQSQRDQSRASAASSEQSSLSSTTMQNMPVMPPYPAGDDNTTPSANMPSGPSADDLDSFPPPPPPPKEQSAFTTLQRSGDLERRASRRYSAYQISKHLGTGGPGVPMLPPTQTTPIPNRGRGEMRESMRAMQARETARHNRNGSSQSKMPGADSSSPARGPPPKMPDGPDSSASDLLGRGSPAPPAPDEKMPSPPAPAPATPNGPSVTDSSSTTTTPTPPDKESTPTGKPRAGSRDAARATTPEKQAQPSSFSADSSPQNNSKELTLFLQYRSKVKKFVLADGYSELSIGRLQLAFIEKFSWNTQQNGVDLPDIYIQDPVSGVRHELEELGDIKDRTVLALNVEPLDEVKKHIDDGLGSLKSMVEQVRLNMDDQGAALRRVSDRQQETAKDLARLAAAPPSVMTPPADSPRMAPVPVSSRKPASSSQLGELQSLRRDLAVLRQTYSGFQAEVEASMSAVRSKAGGVKVAAAKLAVPDVEGDSGHAYVKRGRRELSADSDRLVNRVDDLQDLVEDLRKDVVHRGVRPLPRQLEAVAKDVTTLTQELRKMDEYMRREKPIWTKIWERELEEVCQGRDELRLMEDLMVDLRDDLEKATETFALVEQATKEQMKDAGPDGTPPPSRQLVALGNRLAGEDSSFPVDPSTAKEGVLGEVRALRPNHEDRLEAIERAEKLRQKELESRRENPLKKELTSFVGEGKLKKSGGVEEVERARKAKDDRIRREVWERQNGVVLPEGGGEAEAGAPGEG